MSSKRSKPMPETTEDQIKPVRLDLSSGMHYLLRMEAAKEQMSMASFARKIVETVLLERTKKGNR